LGGLQFEYQYDGIGNRTFSKFGGDEHGGDLRTMQYSVNSLNQYTSVNRTDSNPDHGAHYVVGYAGVPVSSTPNAIEVNNEAATLQESFFFAKLTGANASAPVVVPLTLEERPDGGSTTTSTLGSVYLPVTLGTSSTFTGFAYDGWNIVAALEQSTPLAVDMKIVRSVWGLDRSGGFQGAGGVGGLLATRTAESIYNSGSYSYPAPTESKRHFPSFDGNGNIIAWTDDAGATTTTRDFDAFGNVLTNQGTRWSASTPYGFSTKYEDVETGLLYYGYRYYDPVTGRWPSRDPIGERGGVNLYGMVRNDAVNGWDELGLKPGDEHDTFGEALKSGATYIADLTTKSRELGVKELFSSFMFSPISLGVQGYLQGGNYTVWFVKDDPETIRGIFGREHAMSIFCVNKTEGGRKFIEGSMVKGDIPSAGKKYDGTAGNWNGRVSGSQFSDLDESVYQSIDSSKRVAMIHTHNLGEMIYTKAPAQPSGYIFDYNIVNQKTGPPSSGDKSAKATWLKSNPGMRFFVAHEGGATLEY